MSVKQETLTLSGSVKFGGGVDVDYEGRTYKLPTGAAHILTLIKDAENSSETVSWNSVKHAVDKEKQEANQKLFSPFFRTQKVQVYYDAERISTNLRI
jgi:hypothetical protein